MEGLRSPDCARVQTLVEEHHQCRSPVPTDGERLTPTAWPFQLVGGEIQRVDFRLCQVVPPGYDALRLDLGEPNLRELLADDIVGLLEKSEPSDPRTAIP